jgi:hypothetical protein
LPAIFAAFMEYYDPSQDISVFLNLIKPLFHVRYRAFLINNILYKLKSHNHMERSSTITKAFKNLHRKIVIYATEDFPISNSIKSPFLGTRFHTFLKGILLR